MQRIASSGLLFVRSMIWPQGPGPMALLCRLSFQSAYCWTWQLPHASGVSRASFSVNDAGATPWRGIGLCQKAGKKFSISWLMEGMACSGLSFSRLMGKNRKITKTKTRDPIRSPAIKIGLRATGKANITPFSTELYFKKKAGSKKFPGTQASGNFYIPLRVNHIADYRKSSCREVL